MNRIVLVCGGRQFNNRNFVFWCLDTLVPQLCQPFAILEGGARGADRCGREWAIARGRPFFTCPAPWTTHDDAGPKRNQWMLDFGNPIYALAFPGGSGTRDMVNRLQAAGVPVWEPKP